MSSPNNSQGNEDDWGETAKRNLRRAPNEPRADLHTIGRSEIKKMSSTGKCYWLCGFCKAARFSDYHNALVHERTCAARVRPAPDAKHAGKRKSPPESLGQSSPQKRSALPSASSSPTSVSAMPPPADTESTRPEVRLVGDLSCSGRCHIIDGIWCCQCQDLRCRHYNLPRKILFVRTIPPEEDPSELLKDGEFECFSNFTNDIERENRTVPKRVKLTFREKRDDEGVFEVHGRGANEYGVFEFFGTAKKHRGHDMSAEYPTYNVSLSLPDLFSPESVSNAPPLAAGDRATAPGINANLPLLVGTLAYSDRDNVGCHVIRGKWKHENSMLPRRRFELVRIAPPEEDPSELPKDGEFDGYFCTKCQVETSKGKMKGRKKVVPESGVKLSFREKQNDDGVFEVKGSGTNEYGVFELFGTAARDKDWNMTGDKYPTYRIYLRKRYVGPPPKPPRAPRPGHAAASVMKLAAINEGKSKDRKRKHRGDSLDSRKRTALPGGGTSPRSVTAGPPPAALSATTAAAPKANCLSRLLEGTISYSDRAHRDGRHRQFIWGSWRYENSTVLPQGFGLKRTTSRAENLKELPKEGEFNGFFNVQRLVKTSKGKMKMKNRAVTVSGVKLFFIKREEEGTFDVKGVGSSEYGMFELYGTARKKLVSRSGAEYQAAGEGYPTYSVSLLQKYTGLPPAPPMATANQEVESKERRRPKISSKSSQKTGNLSSACPPTHCIQISDSVAASAGSIARQSLIGTSITSADAQFAASLQAIEDRKAIESAAMLSTLHGKAYKFTEMVLNECSRIGKQQSSQALDIRAVAADDMVFQAEALLNCQSTFIDAGKDAVDVDIGFHFTKEERLGTIRTGGLMTRKDLQASSMLGSQQRVGLHGSVFGDGVYTCNDLVNFKKYGDVGLLVARLKGNVKRIKPNEIRLGGTLEKPALAKVNAPLGEQAIACGFDSVVGNKSFAPQKQTYDEVVLLRSNQVIPLIRFPASLIQNRSNGVMPVVLKPWLDAMKKVVGDYFNSHEPIDVLKTHQSENRTNVQASSGAATGTTRTPFTRPSSSRQTNHAPAHLLMTAYSQQSNTRSNVEAPGTAQMMNHAFQASSGTAGNGTGLSKPSSSQRLSGAASNVTGMARRSSSSGQNQAPAHQRTTAYADIVEYNAPFSLSDTNLVEKPDISLSARAALADEVCAICHDNLATSRDLRKIKKCEHIFCAECIRQSLRHCRKCPTCQTLIGEPQGTSPSGKMEIRVKSHDSCAGYPGVGSIWIRYVLYGGIQKEYHDEKGKAFEGTTRKAYLPDNDDGRRLLKRLKFAFSHGLTFRIGTSLTTKKSGVITWASIHHKTSLQGGTHGWPDATFFLRCNKELDELGVQMAHDCA